MQYFYLVCRTYDECTRPVKVFLDKMQAVKFGRRLASISVEPNVGYDLWKQPTTSTGQFEFVRSLPAYSDAKSAASIKPLESFDWDAYDNAGSDYDIDKGRV